MMINRQGKKSKVRRLFSLIVVTVLLFTLWPLSVAADTGQVATAKGYVNVRTGASTNHAIVLTIPTGGVAQVVSPAVNGWMQISYNGKTGWTYAAHYTLSTPAIPTPSPAPTGQTATANGYVNVRTGGGTNYAIVMTVPTGGVAQVLSPAVNGWMQISYNGKTGWTYAAYYTLSTLSTPTPTPTPEPTPTPTPPPAPTGQTATANGYVNVRTGGGTNYAIVLTIPTGGVAQVLSSAVNGWMQISYNGKAGWTYAAHYTLSTTSTPTPTPEPTPTPAPTTALARANNAVNMRSGPSEGYPVLLTIPVGRTATIIEQSTNGWLHLQYEGKSGWSYGQWFTRSGPDVPTVTPPSPPPTPTPPPSTGGTKYVALTFDDGPSAYTPRLLNTLAANGARATFFMVGSMIPGREGTVARMVNEGHQVANHSYGHPDFTLLSWNNMVSQVTTTDNLIRNASGVTPTMFRPPYGARNSTVLSAVGGTGKAIIIWNKDPVDWSYRNAAHLTNFLLTNVVDGDIVLMHDLYGTTVDGVAAALPTLKARGYQFVTVAELFRIKGITPLYGAQYFSAR